MNNQVLNPESQRMPLLNPLMADRINTSTTARVMPPVSDTDPARPR